MLEKESRLRESMKMMGLKPSALFSAWFVKQFLFLLLTALLVSGLLKVCLGIGKFQASECFDIHHRCLFIRHSVFSADWYFRKE